MNIFIDMQIKSINILIFLLAHAILMSCKEIKHHIPAEVAPLSEIAYEAIQLPRGQANDYVSERMKNYEKEFNAMMAVSGYDNPSESISAWIMSPAVKVFAPDAHNLAPSNDKVSYDLGQILGNAKDLGLNISHKGYASTVWGKNQSILFCDSIMLIALNHYLGSNYEGYSSIAPYRRKVKTQEMLPYDMAEALVATSYPYKAPEGEKAINRIVYEGILAVAKMRLVENANPAYALGYSHDEYKWLEDNERNIWDKMVSSKLIFDTSELTIERLVMPSPSCRLISDDTPGRAGRYIGYKIVKAYLDAKPSTSLAKLLQGDMYSEPNPLTEALYNPK